VAAEKVSFAFVLKGRGFLAAPQFVQNE